MQFLWFYIRLLFFFHRLWWIFYSLCVNFPSKWISFQFLAFCCTQRKLQFSWNAFDELKFHCFMQMQADPTSCLPFSNSFIIPIRRKAKFPWKEILCVFLQALFDPLWLSLTPLNMGEGKKEKKNCCFALKWHSLPSQMLKWMNESLFAFYSFTVVFYFSTCLPSPSQLFVLFQFYCEKNDSSFLAHLPPSSLPPSFHFHLHSALNSTFSSVRFLFLSTECVCYCINHR